MSLVRRVPKFGFKNFNRVEYKGINLDVLELIAEGLKTKEIADRLHVTSKTVEYHRAQLMARLRIPDVPGLVRYAAETQRASKSLSSR